MPRAKVAAHLSGLIGSDSEPDFDDFEPIGNASVRKANHTMPAVKKARGRPAAANRVTKPAPATTRRSSGRVTAAVQAQERKALADKSNTNAHQPSSSKEMPAKANQVRPEETGTKATRGRPRAAPKTVQTTPAVADDYAKQTVPGARRGRPPAKKAASSLPVEIPETQQADPMDVCEDSEMPVDNRDISQFQSDPAVDYVTELDETDASLRRRLGDLMRKYDSLERRHRDLKEVGIREAESVYERLKKQSEENKAASNILVEKLKEEITAQASLLKQSESRQQLLDRSEARAAQLEEQVAALTTTLTDAKAEIKTLSMRLAASRTAEANANAKVPGSAIKANSANGRMVPSEAVQAALAKEDLYGDLTGLIIRDIKRDESEDVFDCIQTGRNGTLHFKLVLERPDSSGDYDAVNLTYLPQLDPDRDEELMEVLPDYLVEEITFPRPHASKFYTRVIKSLNERLD